MIKCTKLSILITIIVHLWSCSVVCLINILLLYYVIYVKLKGYPNWDNKTIIIYRVSIIYKTVYKYYSVYLIIIGGCYLVLLFI